MSLKIGLAGLGTAGRAVPVAIAKVPGYEFTAGADKTDGPHAGRLRRMIATAEVCLAILQSNERREVVMAHQVSSPY